MAGTKLTDYRVRAGGARIGETLSRVRSTGRHLCLFAGLSYNLYVGTISVLYINLAKTIYSPLGIPETLPNSTCLSNCGLLVAHPHKQPALACTVDFPQTSQRSTSPAHVIAGLSLHTGAHQRVPDSHEWWLASVCC